MPIAQDLRRGLIASVLLCAAVSSAALTLGRSRGVALIGRSLDVSIALTLDSPGQAGELCPQADVFHGDSRVQTSRVTVGIEPQAGLNALVRVRSSQAVDEPVVTVYLRLGCTQTITRRYVLLSEQPGDSVPPVAMSAPAAVTPAPAGADLAPRAPATAPTTAPAAGAERSAREAGATPGTRSRRAPEPAATATARVAPAARAERSLPQRRASGRGGARLKVDMLDLAPERDPQLRSTAALAGEPTTSDQVRAQAAALWRSINAQPEDVLRDLQRVQALENDVKGLRTLVAGNDRTLGELREQLKQARQERTLTLAVIALLLLLLSAAIVTWWLRRGERRGGSQWWSRNAADAESDAATGGGKASAGTPGRVVDVDLRVDESIFRSLKEAAPAVPRKVQRPASAPTAAAPVTAAAASPREPQAPVAAPVEGPPSAFHSSFQAPASMRMVKAEELVDIQQQADFFMSLGQTEQAIDVLENHIRNNVDTSALVWLDLLAIYRALKRPEDYEMLRSDFQRVFNAEVPSYDATPTLSGGLEDYPRALSRIAALWPSPKVMDVIEESIFRKPGMAEGKPFDLEAYRELVLLYNLGREVVQPVSVPAEEWTLNESPTSSFFETSMQPLSIARDSRQLEAEAAPQTVPPGIDDSMLMEVEPHITTLDDFPDPQMPRPSPRLGIDIDLSGPPPAAADSGSVDFDVSGNDEEDAGRPSKR